MPTSYSHPAVNHQAMGWNKDTVVWDSRLQGGCRYLHQGKEEPQRALGRTEAENSGVWSKRIVHEQSHEWIVRISTNGPGCLDVKWTVFPILVVERPMAHTARTGHSCGSQSPGPGKEPFRMDKSWLLPERRG